MVCSWWNQWISDDNAVGLITTLQVHSVLTIVAITHCYEFDKAIKSKSDIIILLAFLWLEIANQQ